MLIKTIETSSKGPLQEDTVTTIIFQNFGPTRADRFVLKSHVEVDGAEIYGSTMFPVVSLAATDVQPCQLERMDRLLKGHFADVQSNKKVLRIVGSLTYHDVFSWEHRLQFTLKWEGAVNVFATEQYDSDSRSRGGKWRSRVTRK